MSRREHYPVTDPNTISGVRVLEEPLKKSERRRSGRSVTAAERTGNTFNDFQLKWPKKGLDSGSGARFFARHWGVKEGERRISGRKKDCPRTSKSRMESNDEKMHLDPRYSHMWHCLESPICTSTEAVSQSSTQEKCLRFT